MKSLCDGFYIYTNYNIIDGVKHQTIRAIFEYSNNVFITIEQPKLIRNIRV